MNGLMFKISVPYFVAFRKPTSNSSLSTFPVPPFTTIRGMISNAMGLARDDFALQDMMEIGIAPVYIERPVKEKALMLKMVNTPKDNIKAFWTSPFWRDFMVMPEYKIYIKADDGLIDEIYEALIHPIRPLYIGQSDDMVVIEDLEKTDVVKGQSDTVNSIVEGLYDGCELVKLLYKFQDKDTLIYTPTVSVPRELPYKLNKVIEGYYFKSDFVQLF